MPLASPKPQPGQDTTLPAWVSEIHDVVSASANRVKGRWQGVTPAVTFTGTAYTNVVGSVAFTKILSGSQSDVEVEIVASGYLIDGSSVGPVYLGVRIGSTDYDVAKKYVNAVSDHRGIIGSARIPNIPAGPYTVQLRGKTDTTGTGRTCKIDDGDWVTLDVREIPL